MTFATQKILWGFVEKSSIRVPNYTVCIRKGGEEVTATTNANGFYQINLGNLHSGFDNGDVLLVQAVGDVNFYGESSIILAGGTTTQQVTTIDVTPDLDPPVDTDFSPVDWTNQAKPRVCITIQDFESGPDLSTLEITYNANPIVLMGMIATTSHDVEIIEFSPKVLLVKIQNDNPFADGKMCSITGSIKDKVGNELVFYETFGVDLFAPECDSVTPAEGEFVTDPSEPLEIELSDNVSGVSLASIVLTVNDVDYTLADAELTYSLGTLTFVPAAPYGLSTVVDWSLSVTDMADNLLEKCACFVIAAEGPVLDNCNPEPNSYVSDYMPTISVDLIEGSNPLVLSTFVLVVNGENILPGDPRLSLSSTNAVFVPIASLTTPVSVTASINDTMGLDDVKAWTFGIDTVAPIIHPNTPVPDGFVKSPLSVLRFLLIDSDSAIDPDSISVTINGDVFHAPHPNIAFYPDNLSFTPSTPFNDSGPNTVVVQAADLAGNEAAPFSLTFYVDAEAPYIISTDPSPGSFTNDLDQDIFIRIADDGSGINPASIVVTIFINGTPTVYTSTHPQFSFDGELITITTTTLFDPSDNVSVELFVKDFCLNTLDITATSFGFDLSPFTVTAIDPEDDSFVAVDPEVIVVCFNKNVDLSDSTLDVDVVLSSRNAQSAGPFATSHPLDSETDVDIGDPTKLIIVPADPLTVNRDYRVDLTNRVMDTAGNALGGAAFPPSVQAFDSEFTFYQPGDANVDGVVDVCDLLKYAKVVIDCATTIVSPLSELVDLTGDGYVDHDDLLLLQNIILGEASIDDIVVAGSVPITGLPVPIPDGSLTAIELTGFPSKPVADKTEGKLSLVGASNLCAIQVDVTFDPNVLLLIDIIPTVATDIFRWSEVEPGRVRLIFVNLGAGLVNDIADFKFRVIGGPNSPIEIDPSGLRICSKGEAFVTPGAINNDFFVTDLASPIISTIEVLPESLLVPSDVRETSVTAQLLDASSTELFAESVPLEWTVIGNGFMLTSFTATDPTGKSKNFVHLSGPVNSSVRVEVKVRFAPTIDGLSAPIVLFDSQAVSMRITSDKTAVGTGEPVQFRAFVKTVDGLEFETTDVDWEIDSPIGAAAVIGTDGEFVAFEPGQYRIRATLKSDPSITALSVIVTASAILQLEDCNDNPLPLDTATGLSKLGLGSIFAGNKTGTQEVHIRNIAVSDIFTMKKDILLNLDTDPLTSDLKTEFSQIIPETFKLSKRGTAGNIQCIPLENGDVRDWVVPPLLLADADSNGIVTVYLDHVNVSNVGVFDCGPNSCIGAPARIAFKREKDSILELTADGDFYVDKITGRIFIKITSDAQFPGKLCYWYKKSAVVDYDRGCVTLLNTDILIPCDIVCATYQFLTGALENISITVEDGDDTDILISDDGISFGKTVLIGFLASDDIARFYVKACTDPSEPIGPQSGGVIVEADLLSVSACI